MRDQRSAGGADFLHAPYPADSRVMAHDQRDRTYAGAHGGVFVGRAALSAAMAGSVGAQCGGFGVGGSVLGREPAQCREVLGALRHPARRRGTGNGRGAVCVAGQTYRPHPTRHPRSTRNTITVSTRQQTGPFELINEIFSHSSRAAMHNTFSAGHFASITVSSGPRCT